MEKALLFFLQLVLIMLIVIMMIIILFLLLKTQNYAFLLQLYQQETIKNYQNFFVKDLKDQFIGMNIKQKVIIKIQQTNLDFFLNQILLESIDYLFQFFQIKMLLLKYLKLKDIIYQKELLIIIMSSSMEKTFMTKQLNQISNGMKKLEN